MTTTFEPSHLAAHEGQATWPEPDGTLDAGPPLPALLPVAVRDERGGWALIECSNGWTAWVDADLLLGVGEEDAEPATRAPVRLGRVIVSVPLIGGLAMILSAFLSWFEAKPLGFASLTARDFPVKFLTDNTVFDGDFGAFLSQTSGTSIGTVLIVLGVATVVLSQTKVPSMVTRIIGVVVLVMATLFITQMQRGMGQLVVARVFSVVGMGVYVAAVSGLVVALARGPVHEQEPKP